MGPNRYHAENKPVLNTIILTPFVASTLVLYHILKQKSENMHIVFTDNNPRLHGKEYDGIEIISSEKARKEHIDAKVILCAYQYAKSLNIQYSGLGFTDIETDCGKFFDKNEALSAIKAISTVQIADINKDMENDIQNFMNFWGCYFLPAEARRDGALIIDAGSISITQRCNLRCKDCGACTQYYKNQKDYSLETNIKTFDAFMQKVDYVRTFGIFGGEPLLYREFPEFITHVNNSGYIDKLGIVTISTNGTIVPGTKTLELLSLFRVHVNISDYGPYSRKCDELVYALKAHNISYKRRYDTVWYSMCKIINGEEVSDAEAQERFLKCQVPCRCIKDGKFYYCPFIAALHELRASPDNAEDYIDLTDAATTKEDILRYLERKESYSGIASETGGFYPGCRWCSGCDYSGKPIKSAIQAKKPLPYKEYE